MAIRIPTHQPPGEAWAVVLVVLCLASLIPAPATGRRGIEAILGRLGVLSGRPECPSSGTILATVDDRHAPMSQLEAPTALAAGRRLDFEEAPRSSGFLFPDEPEIWQANETAPRRGKAASRAVSGAHSWHRPVTIRTGNAIFHAGERGSSGLWPASDGNLLLDP
jgi:hypothetical protein